LIVLDGVSKKFGTVRALNDLSLEVPAGSTVALLGPNGSGKSTLLKLVAGLLKPSAGRVTLDGRSPRESKPDIGYLGHEPFLYRYLSASENLNFYADLYSVGRSRVPDLLREVGLDRKGDALVRTFSRGESQRLGIARALLHDPRFLLLDEPFSGLDEASAGRLPELISRPGRTVLLSTHDLTRANEVAATLIHLAEGRRA
jgi:heme ABC exporter ATP-binding subunit CcmA